jgi:protein TonB
MVLTSVLLLLVAAAGQQNSSTSDSQNPPCKPQTPAATTPFDTCKYVTLGPGIRPPKAVSTPQPTYPEPARKSKLSGVVVVALAINENGYVDDVKVVRSSNRIFEQNAMDAVRQWVFAPATKDGKPVAVQIDSEANFKLY